MNEQKEQTDSPPAGLSGTFSLGVNWRFVVLASEPCASPAKEFGTT